MHNHQLQPSGRMQGFGLQSGDAATESNAETDRVAQPNPAMPGTNANAYAANAPEHSNAPTGGYGKPNFQGAADASGTRGMTGMTGTTGMLSGTAASNSGYGNSRMPGDAGMSSPYNASSTQNAQQLSYDQFQEQVRQRQEQEQMMARQALLSAGADRQSDRTRAVLQQLASLSQEIQRAENQIQVQMDAQLRQLQLIHQRVRQAENMIQETLPNMQMPSTGLRQ